MGRVVILGTGGTIAGTGDDPQRTWHYRAAQLSAAQLVAAVPALQGVALDVRQVAQVDSKDMGWAIWRELAQAVAAALAQDEVDGVVITHGTDTLEETAYLLHALLDGRKPVVLTAAMRPATAEDADGPGNLRDAVRVVQEASRRSLGGVVAVLHGCVWAGAQVRKAHSHQLDAFDGGGHAPLARLDDDGGWLATRPWLPGLGLGVAWMTHPAPRVEILVSHADADGWLLRAALAQSAVGTADPLRGVVVASTGHGTVHQGLEAALHEAARQGVLVWRSSRVARGGVMAREGDVWPACGDLTPAQARVALMLHLLRQSQAGVAPA